VQNISSYGQIAGPMRRLICGLGVLVVPLCAATGLVAPLCAATGLMAQFEARPMPHMSHAANDVWFLSLSFWAGIAAILALTAWRVRDRVQIRRQSELRLAVENRTEQLERGQEIEASRNRILEMLVSNEPLDAVLDAIARSVREQVPGALCAVLVKRTDGLKPGNDFFVGAAPVVPANWLAAIGHPRAVPFEVWRQRCEYLEPQTEPAWLPFIGQLERAEPLGDISPHGGPARGVPARGVPATIRSVPIGNSGSSLGALLLLYPEPAGGDPWERILSVSARLAQIAIEHRRFCDQLDYQAHHDSLTGLPNRVLLNERLEGAVMEARARSQRLAFFYIDVDEFKQINDRYSHRAGDAVLMEIGNRIRSVIRTGDVLARIGGDEFNVVLPDIADGSAAMELASRLLEAARQPIAIQGFEGFDLAVTLSIGMALYPDDGDQRGDAAADLQRQADAAMYYAKSLGKNRAQAFSENAQTLDSVRMAQNLRRALQEDWFSVYYQPKVTADGELAGMEALIRMNHPQYGQIQPTQFIAIAEATGLIVPIGAWVIAQVCRQMAEWRRRNLAPVAIAVNVSAIQIGRSDFAKSVETCLAAHSIPPCCLELEVTERLAVNADSEEDRQMQLLRAMGVCISIDDFGTGFSSLSCLHRLSIDAVKLDRSFVQTIDIDRGAQQLVRAVIGVARGLGLDVIAEGVETEEQRVQLVAAGCPVMQGYLFARPGLPEAVELFLRPDLSRQELPGEMDPDGDLSRLYGAIEAASRVAHEAAPKVVSTPASA